MSTRWLLLAQVIVGLLPVSISAEELADELSGVPYKIVFETWRDNNWELCMTRADGSDVNNLTQTPDLNELYPHVSPDGTKVCFVSDEGAGAAKVRNVYFMNLDGTNRTLVARNARQPCWKADSTAIAYLKGEADQFTYTDYATKGVFVYDLATQQHTQHPNKKLFHLYNLCWSPDGKWFLATVHAGMGFSHAILAFEADGMAVHDLQIPGCRPDISPDGRRVAWGPSDWALRVGDLDFSGDVPRVVERARCRHQQRADEGLPCRLVARWQIHRLQPRTRHPDFGIDPRDRGRAGPRLGNWSCRRLADEPIPLDHVGWQLQ